MKYERPRIIKFECGGAPVEIRALCFGILSVGCDNSEVSRITSSKIRQ